MAMPRPPFAKIDMELLTIVGRTIPHLHGIQLEKDELSSVRIYVVAHEVIPVADERP